jgi:acetyl esterase/lipase
MPPGRPLDPQLAAVLARLPVQRAGFDDMSVIRAMRDTRALLHSLGRELPTHQGVTTANRTIPGASAGAALGLRCYTPAEGHGGVLLFFHGGGYVIGDLYTEEQRCLLLAADSGCVVVSVDYALAPESPYPGALEDAVAALQWAAGHAGEVGGDATRLAVGGSSAGGGLAAATALWARDHDGPSICFQLLVYPMLDDRIETPSMRGSDDMVMLDRTAMAQAWSHYLGGRPGDAYAAPARAEDLANLPPAYVLAAEHDPLRDEDVDYARRLSDAGVPSELHVFPGAFHGFDLVGLGTEVGRRAVAEQCAALKRALAFFP